MSRKTFAHSLDLGLLALPECGKWKDIVETWGAQLD